MSATSAAGADRPIERVPAPPSVLSAALVVAVAPVAYVYGYTVVETSHVVLLALGALGAAVCGRVVWRRSWPPMLVLVVAPATGAAVATLNGRFIGLWVTALCAQAWWGSMRLAPLRFLRPAATVGRSLLVLNLLGAILLTFVRPLDRLLVAAVVLGGFLVLLLGSVPIPALQRFGPRVERGAATLVRWLVTPVLWVVSALVVLVPWIVQRVARWDATGLRGRPQRAWLRRAEEPQPATRLWLPESDRSHATVVARVHGLAVSAVTGVVAAALVLGGWIGVRELREPGAPNQLAGTGGGADPAGRLPDGLTGKRDWNGVKEQMNQEPWSNVLSSEAGAVYDGITLSQFVGSELPDATGEVVNIADGVRASWRPPSTRCGEPLRVWIFGGSTLFGMGARDDHTVASEMARAAAADGIALSMSNYGVPGDVAWLQARRLARALEVRGAPPEAVVFYDGGNDLAAPAEVNGTDRLAVGDYVGPLDPVHMTLLANLTQEAESGIYHLQPREPRNPQEHPRDVLLDRAAEQYEDGHELARGLLEPHDVPFLAAFQPLLAAKDEVHPDEAQTDEVARAALRGFRARLAVSVYDLSDAFDGVTDPHYVDGIHLDEGGNDVAGAALWQALEPELAPLATARGATCEVSRPGGAR